MFNVQSLINDSSNDGLLPNDTKALPEPILTRELKYYPPYSTGNTQDTNHEIATVK